MTSTRTQLIATLQNGPNDAGLKELVHRMETEHPADLTTDADMLTGVWELRWSSSSQPWLKQSAILDNLQILDTERQKGCNQLRLRGPLKTLAAVTVQVDLKITGRQRVEVNFRRGGWVGPKLPGGRQLALMREVNQSFPAWLDITVLDEELRICRGNAGTTFALLRRSEMSVSDFI